MKKKIKNKRNFGALILVGFLFGLLLGGIMGASIQQMIFGAGLVHIAESFKGNIDINMNESKIIQETKDTLVPALTSILNHSVMYNFANCKPVRCECWEQGCALYCMKCGEK